MTDQPADLRDRIVAAMRRAPFEDLRADWNAPNGPLKITARIDDLADAVLAELRTVPVVPVSSPPPDQTAVEERVARRLAGAWISEEDWQRRPANFRAEYLAYARDVLAFVPLPPPVHKGGNADDCPACQTDGLDTIGPPYECPGPETAASGEEVGA